MPLYDIDGTATGAATVDGSPSLTLDIVDPITGSSSVTGDTVSTFNVSGYVVGSGELIDGSLKDLAGSTVGGSNVAGDVMAWMGIKGFIQGSARVALSQPRPIVGVGVVTGYLDVVHVPPPLCATPTVSLVFRWGHTFTMGDILYQVPGGVDPVWICYSMYQMQTGCALKRIGPANRQPVKSKPGCYYVTGTAGECGQPGLWAVRWRWQRSYSDPVVEELCYFQVVDAISSPVPGDTLTRYCKIGWN